MLLVDLFRALAGIRAIYPITWLLASLGAPPPMHIYIYINNITLLPFSFLLWGLAAKHPWDLQDLCGPPGPPWTLNIHPQNVFVNPTLLGWTWTPLGGFGNWWGDCSPRSAGKVNWLWKQMSMNWTVECEFEHNYILCFMICKSILGFVMLNNRAIGRNQNQEHPASIFETD